MLMFYGIGYKHELDMYYDFAAKEHREYAHSTRLLPTEELAKQFIKDHLNDDYTVVEVEVRRHNYDPETDMEETNYVIGKVDCWEKFIEKERPFKSYIGKHI